MHVCLPHSFLIVRAPPQTAYLNMQPNSTDRILDAAERLIAEAGPARVTLEAVAEVAHVSKGGLLYHFPTKEALLQAMIERHLNAIDERVSELQAADPAMAANGLLALLTAAFAITGPEKRFMGASLIAASAANPALMTLFRKHYADVLRHVESRHQCTFEEGALLLLAADGLVLGELLHFSPFTPEQRERIVATLLKRAAACSPVP